MGIKAVFIQVVIKPSLATATVMQFSKKVYKLREGFEGTVKEKGRKGQESKKEFFGVPR